MNDVKTVSDSDSQQLRMLSIAHYIVGGLVALSSCFALIHVTIGLMLYLNPPPIRSGNDPFPAHLFGLLFAGMGTLMIVIGWTLGICLAIAGRSLELRKRYRYCMVIAAIICLFPPLCTALGVLTLVVLSRPSVQGLFAAPPEEDTAEVPFADADDGVGIA